MNCGQNAARMRKIARIEICGRWFCINVHTAIVHDKKNELSTNDNKTNHNTTIHTITTKSKRYNDNNNIRNTPSVKAKVDR